MVQAKLAEKRERRCDLQARMQKLGITRRV